MLEMITPSENLRQSMEFKRGTEKIVIELVVPSITEGQDNGMEHTRKVLKEWIDSPNFNYSCQLPAMNPQRVFNGLSRRERVLLDPLAASQRK